MLGQRLDEQRLGQPGHADEQAVAAGEQRDQHLIDDLVLADDDLAAARARMRSRPGDPRARSSSVLLSAVWLHAAAVPDVDALVRVGRASR